MKAALAACPMVAAGTEVMVDHRGIRLDVSAKHKGRKGVIVAGPEVQFGVKKYQVRLELKGRETVPEVLWLPASVLLKRKA